MAVQKGRKIDDNRCSGLDGKIPPAPRSDQIAWFVEFPALELKKIEGGKDAWLLMKQFAVYMDTLGKLIH